MMEPPRRSVVKTVWREHEDQLEAFTWLLVNKVGEYPTDRCRTGGVPFGRSAPGPPGRPQLDRNSIAARYPMTVTFGYTILYVPDVAATIAFYREAFGLTDRFVTPEGDYGELDTGSTVLAFASNELATANLVAAGGFTPLDPAGPPPGVSITLITDQVASLVDVATAAGARRYVDPIDKPWGQTVAYLLDPNGFLIEVATPIPT
jgi:catechol 2,3-dioxygenase-like lactoylglutathione lyase family enzyme